MSKIVKKLFVGLLTIMMALPLLSITTKAETETPYTVNYDENTLTFDIKITGKSEGFTINLGEFTYYTMYVEPGDFEQITVKVTNESDYDYEVTSWNHVGTKIYQGSFAQGYNKINKFDNVWKWYVEKYGVEPTKSPTRIEYIAEECELLEGETVAATNTKSDSVSGYLRSNYAGKKVKIAPTSGYTLVEYEVQEGDTVNVVTKAPTKSTSTVNKIYKLVSYTAEEYELAEGEKPYTTAKKTMAAINNYRTKSNVGRVYACTDGKYYKITENDNGTFKMVENAKYYQISSVEVANDNYLSSDIVLAYYNEVNGTSFTDVEEAWFYNFEKRCFSVLYSQPFTAMNLAASDSPTTQSVVASLNLNGSNTDNLYQSIKFGFNDIFTIKHVSTATSEEKIVKTYYVDGKEATADYTAPDGYEFSGFDNGKLVDTTTEKTYINKNDDSHTVITKYYEYNGTTKYIPVLTEETVETETYFVDGNEATKDFVAPEGYTFSGYDEGKVTYGEDKVIVAENGDTHTIHYKNTEFNGTTTYNPKHTEETVVTKTWKVDGKEATADYKAPEGYSFSGFDSGVTSYGEDKVIVAENGDTHTIHYVYIEYNGTTKYIPVITEETVIIEYYFVDDEEVTKDYVAPEGYSFSGFDEGMENVLEDVVTVAENGDTHTVHTIEIYYNGSLIEIIHKDEPTPKPVVPNTGDNLKTSFNTMVVSGLGLATTIYLKKKEENK